MVSNLYSIFNQSVTSKLTAVFMIFYIIDLVKFYTVNPRSGDPHKLTGARGTNQCILAS